MKTKIIFTLICLIIVSAFAYYFFVSSNKPGKLDSFAMCLENSGAKFYGAYWCPHCQKQKAMFGSSAKKLPYIECELNSTDKKKREAEVRQAIKDGKLGPKQNPEEIGIFLRNQQCAEANIEGYPTWTFSDGSRLSGEVPLSTLSEKTQCSLPQ